MSPQALHQELKALPKQWMVERTFAGLTQSQRLIRDYEVEITLGSHDLPADEQKILARVAR